MKVELMWASQPVSQRVIHLELPELNAFAARVSNPKNQMNTETMPKLLDYLRNNKHWSPFDMTHLCVLVEDVPRAISHQFIRHWSFDFQEFSQRYATIEEVTPIIWEARFAGATNRQGSIEIDENLAIHPVWREMQIRVWNTAIEVYQRAILMGIAPEVARAVLPEGMTPTSFFAAATLRSWIHYFEARIDEHAQKEHRIMAEAMLKVIVDWCEKLEPVITPKEKLHITPRGK